jgi:two-component system, cell cycle sensor histidine kinase and response regulator CckA
MTAFHIVPGDGRRQIDPPVGPPATENCRPPQISSTNDLPASSTSSTNIPFPSAVSQSPTSPAAEFYQAAVLQAGIAIVGLDPTGQITTFNQAATRLFGRSEHQAIGRPIDSLIPVEHRVSASRALQRTLQQRSVNHYEMAFVPPGGKHPVHVGVTLSCVLDQKNQCIGVIAWMRDISNRKELETNLLRTRHMAALGTLAAGVAHHFNNIVCGMNTMVDFALTTEDPATMTRALHMSAEAASRIGYITQSLLAMNCSDPNCNAPDMADLAEELLRFADAVESGLARRGIVLKLELQSQRLATVPRHRFSQALQHLLRNAEESFGGVPEGHEKRITIRTMSQEDQVMLQFMDTGLGIASEHLPQVFDPFFTTKGVQNGGNEANPGLGLTFVHGVVMDLGGHVWADSVPQHGTTINILIPAAV